MRAKEKELMTSHRQVYYLPLLLLTSNLYGECYPSRGNWAEGKQKSILISAIDKVSMFLFIICLI